jgi:hypothetical protein
MMKLQLYSVRILARISEKVLLIPNPPKIKQFDEHGNSILKT